MMMMIIIVVIIVVDDTVVTRALIHPRVRIMRGGAYGHIRAHTYQICQLYRLAECFPHGNPLFSLCNDSAYSFARSMALL